MLSVSTAVNQEDVYPTFTPHPEEKFLWGEAKKDDHSTIIDEATNILVLDHQILGMAAGKCALVVANTSSNPVINHEGEVYPDALGLGHCEVRPDGVDHWAKIKDLPGRLPEPFSRDLIAKLRGYVGQQLEDMVLLWPTFKKHGRNPSMERDSLHQCRD